jgi:myo-inositol 2-dehydrogenase/D-chiro-inositol 1-dehydrogenase/scyllo-inositol 2-dehydrogenase (NAD+)
MAKVHANSLVNNIPNAQLTALVEVIPKVRNETGEAFGIAEDTRFDSLETALDRAQIDAVVITTPTFTHKELAIRAAEAGKHVFLEKPMALTCRNVIRLLPHNRANVLLQLGFMRRFDPEFTAAASRIAAGEIGRPMMIKSLTHGPGLPPPWARSLETSNGLLAEVNSHDWDCVRWLMGSDYQRAYRGG